MANDIKIGSTSIDKVYVGSTAVDKIYVGSTLVWPVWTDPSTYTNIYATTIGNLPSLKKSVYCAANSSIWFKLNQSSSGIIYSGIGCINSNGTGTGSGTYEYYGYDSSGDMVYIGASSLGSTFLGFGRSNYSPYTMWMKFTAGSSAQYVAVMYTVDEYFTRGLKVNGLYGGGNGSSFDVGTIYHSYKYYTCTLRTPQLGYNFYHYHLKGTLNTCTPTNLAIKAGRRTNKGTDYTVWNTDVSSTGQCGASVSIDERHQNWNDTGYPAIDWVYLDTSSYGGTPCC